MQHPDISKNRVRLVNTLKNQRGGQSTAIAIFHALETNLWNQFILILGDPGAVSRAEGIFMGESIL